MTLSDDKPSDWVSRDVPILLSDINETFFRLLVDNATLPGIAVPDFVRELREPLCGPNAAARAAASPVLLLDIQFKNRDWWAAVRKDPTSESAAGTPAFPRAQTVELARTTLTLAWHLARADSAACLVLFGLSLSVLQIVASLRPRYLDQIAEHQYAHLRPRWEDQPSLWRQLLSGRDQANMRTFAIRALELSWADPRRPP